MGLSCIVSRLPLSHTSPTAEARRAFWGYGRELLACGGASPAMANVVWGLEAKKSTGLRG